MAETIKQIRRKLLRILLDERYRNTFQMVKNAEQLNNAQQTDLSRSTLNQWRACLNMLDSIFANGE